jgi:hypothetical protein
MTVYFGLTALILNLVIAVVLTPVFRVMRVREGADETQPSQYTYDPGTPLPTPPRWHRRVPGPQPPETDWRLPLHD